MPFAFLFTFLFGMYLGARYKVLVLVPGTCVSAATAWLYAGQLGYSLIATLLLFLGLTAVMQSGYMVSASALSPAVAKREQHLRRA